MNRQCLFLIAVWSFGAAVATLGAEGAIDFNRDVRPILSDRCFACHGFDDQSREANLRLDDRQQATAERDGRRAIMPGQPDQSELIRRIASNDPDMKMPPPDSNKSLTAKEVAILRQWVQEGARYDRHWSLTPPRANPLPEVQNTRWPQTAIDRFILARLEKEGLGPTKEATPERLLRRVTLDLTGLPPTLEELDAFLYDPSPAAYERAVDRLLASPAFGEHMAVQWLDLARYADTNGYFGDKTRTAWLWRDWVIKAFNENMPFDQFTIEQLAGDLLAKPSTDQLIATGFNRNHMANNETGIIDEEFRVEYVADRLETTAAAWLGMTVGCARCHDHKYDPISQKDYYQLFAFFNNVPEVGLITLDNPAPTIEVPTDEKQRQLQEATARRDLADAEFQKVNPTLQTEIANWEKNESSTELAASPTDQLRLHIDFDQPIPGRQVGTTIQFERGPLGQAARFDATQHIEVDADLDFDAPWTIAAWFQSENSLGCLLSKIEPTGNRRGLEILWQKGRLKLNLVHQWGIDAIEVSTEVTATRRRHHVVFTYDGSGTAAGLRAYVDGSATSLQVDRDSLRGSTQNDEPLRIARRDSGLGFYGQLDELRILQKSVTAADAEGWFWSERLRGILQVAADSRTTADKETLLEYFLDRHATADARDIWRRLKQARKAVSDVKATIPTALVMQELAEPRVTSVLERGQYDQPRERVQPDVPTVLPPWPASAPRNRLGLAQWLLMKEHPLTSRVTANRFWQQFFGEGLVSTVSDFGSQGELPSHPELLDWLAVQFVEDGWDIKRFLKRIVSSAAYRQASARKSENAQHDPENRLIARGPSYRMTAEAIRDQALFVSGLLVPQLGGPSAKPYQPPGLWEAVSYNGDDSYVADNDSGLWRRSLYTFWKRQSPPPAMLTFDSSTREKCTVRRARTNTPLQALVLLNDETYLEAARCLAARILVTGESDDARLRQAFRTVTSRNPETSELVILRDLLHRQRTRFEKEQGAAKRLLEVGVAPDGRDRDPVEMAAWTITLQTLLNLDETVVRR